MTLEIRRRAPGVQGARNESLSADKCFGVCGRVVGDSFRRLITAAALALVSALPCTALAEAAAGWVQKDLVAPSVSHGLHGMKFVDERHVLIGDVVGFSLWRLDTISGEMKLIVPPPTGGADDLAIGPGGLLAWTSLVEGVVYGKSPAGPAFVIARGLPGVNSIGFTRSGRLFATQLGPADTLFELDPTGNTAPTPRLRGVLGLNGFRIDSHDTLWGPRGKTGEIVAIDLKTFQVRVVASGFVWPTGVDLGPDGRLYVIDLTAGTLTAVDPASGVKRLIRQLNPGDDNLTVGPDGMIYVSNPPENTLYRVDPETGLETVIRQGRLGVVGGLAVTTQSGRETLFIGETYSYARIDPETGEIRDQGRAIGSPEIRSEISVRAAGDRVVLSHFNEGAVRIVRVRDNAVLREISGLRDPYDAVLLEGGDLLVAEMKLGQVTRISPAGLRTTFADHFTSPVGLALDRKGGVLITDAGGGTLTRIDLKSGSRREVARNLNGPEGLDVAPDGRVYVAEAGSGRVDEIDVESGRLVPIASGLKLNMSRPAAAGPVWIPAGVAAGSRAVYVSEPATGAVVELQRRVARTGQREVGMPGAPR